LLYPLHDELHRVPLHASIHMYTRPPITNRWIEEESSA